MNESILLFMSIVVLVAGLSSLNWRVAVKVSLVLVIVEGALRKWVLPQASDMVYFLKDVVFFGAYVRYFLLDRISHNAYRLRQVKTLAVLASFVVVAQAFNLRMNSPLVGIVGVKAYLGYIPLCFMVPSLFKSVEELEGFLKRYILIAIPVCVLGIVQFETPFSSPLNTYVVNDTARIATFGTHNNPRITGTFSFTSGHGTYMFVSLVLIVVLLSVRQPIWWKVLLTTTAVLVVGNTFMTGSRGPAFAAALFIVSFLLSSQLGRRVKSRPRLGPLILVALAGAFSCIYWFDEAFLAFWYRANNSNDFQYRVVNDMLEPFHSLYAEEWSGFGTGSTHQGGFALRDRLRLSTSYQAPPPFEEEPRRVLLELGIPGFALWYCLRVYLVVALWRTWQQLRTAVLRNLALAACLVHAIQILGQLVFNPTFAVYYWFVTGFVFLLPKIDRIAKIKGAQGLPSLGRNHWSRPSLISSGRYF